MWNECGRWARPAWLGSEIGPGPSRGLVIAGAASLVAAGCAPPTRSEPANLVDSGASTESGADSDALDSAADTSDTAGAPVDADLDGLPDTDEATFASAYLPFLSLSPSDGCPTMGIVFRATPHPDDPTKLHILYDLLYDADCGAGGHVGDDEVFAVTADPFVEPPEGILAIVAIAHQNTPCESITECGCGGDLPACATAVRDGLPFPAVFASRDKHGNYLDESTCDGSCFLTNWCEASEEEPAPILVNAGEPDAPLTRDLTQSGLITTENGWANEELFDYDPWGDLDFGGAGNVAADLVDSAFDTPVVECGG